MTTAEELIYLREQVAKLTQKNDQLNTENSQLQTQVALLERDSSNLLSIIDQSLFAIAISHGGRFLFLNKAFKTISGFDIENVLELHDYEYINYVHPDDREKARKHILARETQGDDLTHNFKFRLLHKDGHYLHLESWSRRILYKGQYASLSTILDITEKEHVLAELQTSQTKYKTIFEHSPIGIYYSDIHGEMGEVNETTVKILGSPSKEATQKINLFTYPLLVQFGFSAHLRECIETGRSIIADTDYITKWNKRVWLRYYLNPIYKNGKIDGALINFIDITEAKSAELALRQNEVELRAAKERAEESNRLKISFLENMNHEIRTPLNGILGFLDLYEEEDTTPDDRAEYKEIINDCASQLLSVITDILEASTLKSGNLTIHKKSFYPQKLIDHLAFYFEKERKKKTRKSKQNLQFITHCDLPDTAKWITADQDKIQQIMSNLLNNALKFTHNGEIEFGCTLQDNNHLLFYVKDTGIGIAKDKHSIVFERFRQADESLSRNYGGTGLGLAICKSLVELLGGTIGVESEPDKGSYFWFTMPFEPSTEAEPTIRPNAQTSNSLSGKVLLVDDVFIMGEYCKKLVQNTNIELQYVSNGSDAISLCKKEQFDLILMDLQMPVLSGYDTLAHIKENKITTPVVAVTANARLNTKEKVTQAGFVQYLAKPFNQTEFIKMLEQYLTN